MTREVLHKGSCHCQKVKFQIIHSPHLELNECNCSICYIKGKNAASQDSKPSLKVSSITSFPYFPGFQGFVIEKSALKSLEGKENLETYKFGTGTAHHMFCKHCGISPLTVPRSYPDGYNINYRCLQRDNVSSINVTPRDGQNWEQEMAKGNHGKP